VVDGLLRLRLDFGLFLLDILGWVLSEFFVVFWPVESWQFEGFRLVDCSVVVDGC
jgi:hypothetical protein